MLTRTGFQSAIRPTKIFSTYKVSSLVNYHSIYLKFEKQVKLYNAFYAFKNLRITSSGFFGTLRSLIQKRGDFFSIAEDMNMREEVSERECRTSVPSFS